MVTIFCQRYNQNRISSTIIHKEITRTQQSAVYKASWSSCHNNNNTNICNAHSVSKHIESALRRSLDSLKIRRLRHDFFLYTKCYLVSLIWNLVIILHWELVAQLVAMSTNCFNLLLKAK